MMRLARRGRAIGGGDALAEEHAQTADDFLFRGMKVLDVGTWIAAPTTAAMLADLGADVIKIEQPEVGDAYRNYYLLAASPNSAVNFTWTIDSRNKRSITLNLKTVEGKAILERLIRECDVYITNQPLPMRRALGLTFEDLQPLNDRMIYASLTAYGEEGPERDRESFDLVAYWSRSGLMNQMRHAGTQPFQAMAGMGDHPTGVALYASIVTALLRRERTGKGGKVHTSLLANGLWSSSCFAQAAWAPDADFSKIPGQRITTALYQTADRRWIQFSMVRTEDLFDAMLVGLGCEEWLADPRFATPETRIEHAELITGMLREVIGRRSAADWIGCLHELGVPVALVAEFQDLPYDPQVLANDMAAIPAEDVGMARVIRDPVNVDGVRRVGAKKPPALGEHTDEILGELGFGRADIDRMRTQGVI
jgi:crotonobetainyl-CoA:carnitine CoA-transferase CaiB-like acyl-CoA transferase